jgi:3-deoxy-D-manno-octulosonic acid kinase
MASQLPSRVIFLNPIITTYKSVRVGSYRELSGVQLEQLAALLESPQGTPPGRLAGRARIRLGEIEGVGRVAVKTYGRGGLIKRINRYHYLRSGKPRCQKEFEMLARVRNSGISAPEPIAFVYCGRITYRGWLVTREVESPRSLMEVCKENERLCRDSIALVAKQICGLVENRIKHVDLHPGNVLLDGSNHVFIIDFDRARAVGGSRQALQHHYIARWSRAIDKHKMPPLLCEELQSCLSTSSNSR